MSEWRSIDTAPGDGTLFDVWFQYGDGTGERIVDCYIDDGLISSFSSEFHIKFDNEDTKITHWMPQPEPPK